MKVGLLTYHHTTNYGATLQAYALMKVIKSQGHEVEFIDYHPYRLGIAYLKHLYLNKCFRYRYFIDNTIKLWKMRRFVRSHMSLSSKKFYTASSLHQANLNYDLVICGSDEIWELEKTIESIPLGKNLCLSYLLDFIDNPRTRKASYAASCGATKTFGDYREKISQLLQDLDAISVRDANSLRLLREEHGIQATKVIDPTFLADFTELIPSLPIRKRYILVYGSLLQEEENYVKAVADAEGLEIISLGYPCSVANTNSLDIGPEDWLGYYSQASYIFTSFYHGIIFSIIFHKPFTAFIRSLKGDDKSSKVNDLLEDLNLENRILRFDEICEAPKKLNFEMDFNDEKLNQMIHISNTYLANVLSKNNDEHTNINISCVLTGSRSNNLNDAPQYQELG